MRDSEFKALEHPTGQMAVTTRGSETSPGYKPDLTISDTSGVLHFIVESERKTDRKAFLGNLLKASKHAQEIGARPSLVIVMAPSTNTTPSQIAGQLRSYALWLSDNLVTGLALSAVHVLTHDEYLSAIATETVIGSEAFNRLGIHLTVSP